MDIIIEQIDSLVTWITIIVVLIAMYTDILWRKVFNRLTFPAAIIGLALYTLESGWSGLLFSSIGLILGLVIFIVPFVFGKMGGGDVKLIGALGALVGGYGIINIILYTAITGGVLAVVIASYNKKLKDTMLRALKLVGHIIKSVRDLVLVGNIIKPTDELSPKDTDTKSIKMPYSLAIGGGTFCLLIFGRII